MDSYGVALGSVPDGPVQITIQADDQTEISKDGTTFASTVELEFTDAAEHTVTVRAVDDTITEGPHTGTITHAITGVINDANFSADLQIDGLVVAIEDDDTDHQPSGNVDGDTDFDANDSFLIHLTALSGTDAQIDQSKVNFDQYLDVSITSQVVFL